MWLFILFLIEFFSPDDKAVISSIEVGSECLERRHPSIQHSLSGKITFACLK